MAKTTFGKRGGGEKEIEKKRRKPTGK